MDPCEAPFPLGPEFLVILCNEEFDPVRLMLFHLGFVETAPWRDGERTYVDGPLPVHHSEGKRTLKVVPFPSALRTSSFPL